MIHHRVYTLSLILFTLSCTSQSLPQDLPQATSAQGALNTPPVVSTDIRPGPNGPKLELTELEGELLIPTGTRAFVLQSETPLALSVSVRNALTPPVHAAESEGSVIDLEDVQQLSASVNGEVVPLEVLGLEDSEEGQILFYRLKDVPVSDSSALIEFKSQSGSFVVRGLIEKVDQKMRRIDERFDLDSTALAYIWESLGDERPQKLDKKSLALLKQQRAVQQLKNSLYQHMLRPERRPNQKPVPVKDFLPPVISQVLQADPEVKNYLQGAQRCDNLRRRGNACSLPELKPMKRQPLPSPLRRQLSRKGDKSAF